MSNNMPNKTIFVTFQQEGIHFYPEAKNADYLQDVNFLGYKHRHMFHFKIWIEVTHNNRDLEFIQVKRDLQAQLSNDNIDINNKSCEMLSDDLASYIKTTYPNRWCAVEISEDGENGSYCQYHV